MGGPALLPHGVVLSLVAILLASTTVAPRAPAVGDTAFFADVPHPGFPEGIVIDRGLVYVSTPASLQFGFGMGPSKVFVYDLDTAALVDTIVVQGEDPLTPRGMAGMAVDADGRLYVTNPHAGFGILRFTPPSYAQELYATIPDLAPCGALPTPPCSPTLLDRPPFPNDVAFDDKGNLFVTDTMQATLWRVPAGGGVAQVWFQHPAFDQSLGPNGIRVSPDGTHVYVASTFRDLSPLHAAGVYRIPLVAAPSPHDLQLFAELNDGADGIGFGVAGHLYVLLAGANQFVRLAPDGTEEARFPDAASNLLSDHPYDSPATFAFTGSRGTVLATNHAIFTGAALPEHFEVLETYVDDKGAELFLPALP